MTKRSFLKKSMLSICAWYALTIYQDHPFKVSKTTMLKWIPQIKKYTINNKHLLTSLIRNCQFRNLNSFRNIYSLSLSVPGTRLLPSLVKFLSFSASCCKVISKTLVSALRWFQTFSLLGSYDPSYQRGCLTLWSLI